MRPRGPYDYNVVETTFKQPSLTRESFAAETDMHYIIDRFTRTGELNTRELPYGEQPPTFAERHYAMANISNAYESLPESEREIYEGPLDWVEKALQQGQLDSPEDAESVLEGLSPTPEDKEPPQAATSDEGASKSA